LDVWALAGLDELQEGAGAASGVGLVEAHLNVFFSYSVSIFDFRFVDVLRIVYSGLMVVIPLVVG
jgi:hypothetical protein